MPRRSLIAAFGLALAMLCLHAGTAVAQFSSDKKQVEIDLIAETTAIRPGEPFWVALRQRIAPGWHTYWRNPGDAGGPTEIAWDVPAGFMVSDIHWPIPEAIPYQGLMSFGYEDEVLLLARVTPPASIVAREVTLTANADWLVCSDICVPESGSTSLTLGNLTAGAGGGSSMHMLPIALAQRNLPQPAPWSVSAAAGPDTAVLRVAEAGLDPSRIESAFFFPFDEGIVVHAEPQTLAWPGGDLEVSLVRGDLKTETLDELAGVLVIEEQIDGRTARTGFTVTAGVTAALPAAASMPQPSIGFLQALLFAALGGLILNLMPCVFPVLSLKALKIAKHGQGPAAERRAQGMAYGAGVLVSFAAVSALLIGLRASGAALGWGFQFQSSGFVLAMAALFFALGLSLSGVFSFGGSLMGLGSGLAERPGRGGSFFTGVLATVVATPCTAPFMGVAIGYAFTQPPLETLAVLMMVGVGFSAPLVAVSLSTTLARLLPRPGPWMDTLKQVMAFPLYASAAWLVWVLSLQSGSEGVLAAMIVLVGVGFAAWLFGRGTSPGYVRAASAGIIALVSLGAGWQLAADAMARPGATTAAIERTADARWEPFTPARLATLRSEGRPVFIDFTAAWCITCKVNEQVAFSSQAFYDALEAKNVAYMKGDWTRRDPEITAMLEQFGRAGVPLYLLYPGGDADAEPTVLPQILTPGLVLDHLAALPDASITIGQGG